jgi:hypothetical protein
VDLLIDLLRDANRVGLCQRLQAGRDVDAVTLYIALVLYDIAQMDADPDMNLLRGFVLGVIGTELGLNTLGALHGVDHGRELDQEAIPCGLDGVAMMRAHRLVDDPVMRFQQAQHAGFIRAHLAAKADDIREHDGGQAAALASYGTRAVLGHNRDYRARGLQLSNW